MILKNRDSKMRKIRTWIYNLIELMVVFTVANLVSLRKLYSIPSGMMVAMIVLFFVVHIRPSVFASDMETKALNNSKKGCHLLWLFLLSTALSILFSGLGWTGRLGAGLMEGSVKMWVVNSIVAVLVEATVFWNGIIRIYLTSKQLGMRWRVLGILCGWIPIANLIVLFHLIRVVEAEVKLENDKLLLNQKRADEQICKTRYPLLMVHGVFFRDSSYLNYWGRIPGELEKNGATIFYGNHQSAASVEDCAKELTARIKEIVKETGCEKVNIIAHSKGGLDCRYALALTGAAPYVASLTTINTPHKGCEFADYLLSKIPQSQQDGLAKAYNTALKQLGDHDPDFKAAVYDLTADSCAARNEMVKDVEGVYYQSVGSKLNRASGGRFPLNFTQKLVEYFDGSNDGLVGEGSFPWGEDYQLLTVKGKRGISHGDVIDLNRENIGEFDVREFYVQLVSRLKRKGF